MNIYYLMGSIGLDSTVLRLFEIGKLHVEKEEYHDANKTFLSLLDPQKLMPDELAFFFGKSLYHSGGYNKLSIDFLNKYLGLRGDSSKYYHETIAMLRTMGVFSNKEKSKKEPKTTAQKKLDNCTESSHTICPICNGKNVLTSQASFGPSFRECSYCDERGLMPCQNYSKYVEKGILTEYKKE